ncbi:MAG: PIN domain-containing protein [Prevotella sp.]|jgi:predicted nucleic acid-binding protein|nr:PIN domain-containing protein [Prevotella sp.]
MGIGARYTEDDIPKIDNQSLFFDANVLLYLFFTTASALHWQRVYSNIFRKLLNSGKNRLVIDSIITSEVINRALREEHKLYIAKNGDISFKSYRNSQDGKNTLKQIYDIFDQIILPRFFIDGKIYDKKEIETLLKVDNLDFNDKLICKLCEEKKYILITNDKDFISSNIDILSANPDLQN